MSIRTRLFLTAGGLVVFFVAFSLLLNSRYLGEYYIAQKRASLVESRIMIEKIYKGDPGAIALQLENLERNGTMNIYLLGPDFRSKYPLPRVYSPAGIEPGFMRRQPSPLVRVLQPRLEDLPAGGSLVEVIIDPRLKTEFLTLAARLYNGEFLILSSPVAAINESTAIANRFFMFTGLLTVLLGGVAVFFLARRFTKPILELNEIARQMSKLDFSRKYQVQSEDEIGQLGSNINSLSDQLDKAISELTEANARLQEDIERERRIDRMRKEFISNVSHELKTPIALIQGYAEGLKLNISENQADRDFYCDVIMDETGKMNRLVRDLLDLSQIESGYFKLERTDFDISSLIDHVLEKFRPLLQDKGIKVEKLENVVVNGDIGRIEQILVNYLNNAINHVDENKTIKITVSERQGKVRVAVFNSGRPIPEAALEKIWTSFYKVDKARTRAYGGTGLGLSVVRAIQELHNNAFGVENKAGGVVFWFEADT